MIDISKILHDYRVFPRSFLVFYSVLLWEITQWFEAIPEPSTPQVAFISAFVGLGGAVFGFYTKTTSGTIK